VNFRPKNIYQALKELSRVKRTGLALVVVFCLYVFIGFIGVPLAFRFLVFSKVNSTFAGELKVDHVRFNPFTWKFKLKGFTGTTPEGELAVSFEEFRINFQPTSVFGDEYKVRELVLDRPNGLFHIDEKGDANWVSLFEVLGEPKPKKESGEPFVIPPLLVEHLEVRDAGFEVMIDTLEPSFIREIHHLSFVMNDLRTDASHGNDYEFELSTKEGEKLNITGVFYFDPLSTVGRVSLDSLKLPSFTSFGSALVDAEIKSGELGMSFGYGFRPLASKPLIGIKSGELELRDFVLVDKKSGQLRYRVDSLKADGIEFDVVKRLARMESLMVDGASVRVARDRAGAFQWIEKVSDGKPAEVPTSKSNVEPGNSSGIQLGVVADDQDMGLVFTKASEQVGLLVGGSRSVVMEFNQGVIQNSEIQFHDQSVNPGFNIGVSIADFTAGPYESVSDRPMDFKAKVGLARGAKGTIELDGSLIPTAPLKSTNMVGSINGLSMSPFSGYAVPAIGRPLMSGGLTAKLDYSIKDGVIVATNRMNIDQLKLGARAEGSDAPKLPLDLAIAILKNRDGRIELDVPMKGDVKNPKFSVGRMAGYAFQNVIEKIVSAPFAFLIPGNVDGDVVVTYDFGTAKVTGDSEEIITEVQKVISSRPGLVLQIEPTYVVGDDAKALSELHFKQSIDALMEKGQSRKDAVESLHDELSNKEQVPGLFFKDADKMEKAVRDSMKATKDDLMELANRRAAVVRDAMVQEGIDESRVKLMKPTRAKAARVDLTLAAK